MYPIQKQRQTIMIFNTNNIIITYFLSNFIYKYYISVLQNILSHIIENKNPSLRDDGFLLTQIIKHNIFPFFLNRSTPSSYPNSIKISHK